MPLKGASGAFKDRESIKAAFQASPADSRVRILLATDAASEGVNLQNHCWQLIHYEIPWNPNRMEQRNGRVDRFGQKNPEVHIRHFVGKGFDETKPG
jgi:SNF2 family DNA or RNA helicase